MSVKVAARITNTALRTPLQRSAVSTTTTARSRAGPAKNANGNKPEDIEIPAFNVRHLTASPRAKVLLISLFCVFASVEAYGWYNFGPKILGWDKAEEEK